MYKNATCAKLWEPLEVYKFESASHQYQGNIKRGRYGKISTVCWTISAPEATKHQEPSSSSSLLSWSPKKLATSCKPSMTSSQSSSPKFTAFLGAVGMAVWGQWSVGTHLTIPYGFPEPTTKPTKRWKGRNVLYGKIRKGYSILNTASLRPELSKFPFGHTALLAGSSDM